MGHNIIDEYLVKLGFEADSSQGKEFADAYKRIQDQMNQSEQSASQNEQSAQRRYNNVKSRNQSMKGQYSWIGDVEKALNGLRKTASGFQSGNVLGGAISAFRTYQMSKTMFSGETFSHVFRKPSGAESSTQSGKTIENDPIVLAVQQIMQDTEKIAKNTENGGTDGSPGEEEQDWIDYVVRQVQSGNINIGKNGTLDWNDVQRYIKEFQDQSRESAGKLQSENVASKVPSLSAGNGLIGIGEDLSGGVGEAAGAAGAGMSAGAAAGGVALVAVALAAGAAAAAKIADSLAEANVDVESIARSFWMTTSSAWQMTNVLSAMGKTTNDLATIAANPTLRQQYEDLQQYQEQFAQLPSDFQSVNDKWTKGVSTQANELKLQLEYLKEIAGYNLQKMLYTPVASALNELNKFFQTLSLGLTNPNAKLGSKISSSKSSLSSSGSSLTKNQAQSELENYNWSWASAMPSQNYYVPNSSGTSAKSGATITHNPSATVNVYTDSNDPTSVGNAAANAVGQVQAQSQASLIKQIQGVNR